jgi:hypothetical protein
MQTKKTYLRFLIIIVAGLYSVSAYSQGVIHHDENFASTIIISHEVDSVKDELSKQGFTVVKEAPLQMESEYEMPVIVPLNQGTWYQVVFIGDITSKLYEVRMYDWEERQVVYQKKQWGDVDGNVISYSYIPQFSEYHMIKPVQVNKKNHNPLGYIILFKKTKSL